MIDILLFPKKAIAMHVFLQARTLMHAVMATVVGTYDRYPFVSPKGMCFYKQCMLLWQPLWVLKIVSGNTNVKKNFQHYKGVVIHLGQIAATICGLFHTFTLTCIYHTTFLATGFPRNSPSTWSEQLQD